MYGASGFLSVGQKNLQQHAFLLFSGVHKFSKRVLTMRI